MCVPYSPVDMQIKPHVELARLMEHELGFATLHVDSVALRLFIRANWKTVSRLAHAIHEGS